MMNIFYKPDLAQDLDSLNAEESKHCIKVLRLTEGDIIHLIDGKGAFVKAAIHNADSKNCQYRVLSRTPDYGQKKYSLTIAIAPTKNSDRFEWFLEKTTEIGIDRIIPVICRYSERKDLKMDRLEKVIISAIKQSQKAYLPELAPVIKFQDLIKRPFDGMKFIAHCMEGEKQLLKNGVVPGKNTLILIGPEGDFSSLEIEEAIKEGFNPVSLGDARLRTETAGVVACHTVNLLNE